MAETAEGGAVALGGSPGALKHSSSGIARKLREFNSLDEAKRLALLEADRDLVLTLMLNGYQGATWNRFAHALAEYGVQVVRAWVCKGVMVEQCRRKGIGNLPEPPIAMTQAEATGLADETVAEAIGAFRTKVLVPGRWDSTKGASLKTYFIGQCIFRFPNVYRRWASDWKAARAESALDEGMLRPHQPVSHSVAELNQAIERMVVGGGEHIEVLLASGFDQAEAAEVIGVTKSALQTRLHRHREKRREANAKRSA